MRNVNLYISNNRRHPCIRYSLTMRNVNLLANSMKQARLLCYSLTMRNVNAAKGLVKGAWNGMLFINYEECKLATFYYRFSFWLGVIH